MMHGTVAAVMMPLAVAAFSVPPYKGRTKTTDLGSIPLSPILCCELKNLQDGDYDDVEHTSANDSLIYILLHGFKV